MEYKGGEKWLKPPWKMWEQKKCKSEWRWSLMQRHILPFCPPFKSRNMIFYVWKDWGQREEWPVKTFVSFSCSEIICLFFIPFVVIFFYLVLGKFLCYFSFLFCISLFSSFVWKIVCYLFYFLFNILFVIHFTSFLTFSLLFWYFLQFIC